MTNDPWYLIQNVDEIPSPSLLVYPDRVAENVQRMIRMTGGPARLRPHIKTHKLPELIRQQRAAGITKFKCATIAEAEMALGCGALDLLLAYQPVGPNISRLITLIKRFPDATIRTIADDAEILRLLSEAATREGVEIDLLLDVDCGQHRSGTAPDSAALDLYRLIEMLPGLRPGGIHAYDGHIRDPDLEARRRRCEEASASVAAFKNRLLKAGLSVPRVVSGGTPTFPFHARNEGLECSPGTCVLWDHGYSTHFPDMDFLLAALVLTRVVSKPSAGRLCLDLGHKSIASEGPHPRVHLFALPEAEFVAHSEEHLVVATPRADAFAVGDCFYGAPWHICPTVALHGHAVVVKGGRAEERWAVAARERVLTV
ncbi:MAG: D-TA family PLP-dependent enzyme [Planctomycetes bacterium]|nr:D-TA family PLP-dependent enzyme [Planctomycetota bacterium]